MKLVDIKIVLRREKTLSNECTTCCNSGCQSCELCNTGCQSQCDTCQGFCETYQNSSNGFSFSSCVISGQLIGPGAFDRGTWNEAINQINSVFGRGGQSNASWARIANNYTDKFIFASEFNRVASAAGYSNGGVAYDNLIYGQYYGSLENAIANLSYKPNQCDMCNTGCDLKCDSCQLCDGGCNGCDSECGNYCCDCCDNDCCDNDKPPDCKETT